MFKERSGLTKAIFFLFLLLCLFLSFNKHSRDKANSYHGVIWADAAGYYVHLPLWFIYGNNASALPENIVMRTGEGFYADTLRNRVMTKYPCGPAILQLPFFLSAHALASPLGFEPDGFSLIYAFSIYVSGVFYGCLGLWLLFLFLKKHFSNGFSILTVLIFFSCTNLYYYIIDAPGMSHVYSFFLFALFMYSIQRLLTSSSTIHYVLLAGSMALLLITRPTNALLFLFPFFYENGAFVKNIRELLRNRQGLLLSALTIFLILLPQLFYWNTSFGKLISYSYGKEGFDNLAHPYLLETWFSPNNGLFVYAPVLLLAMAGIVMMIRHKQRMGWFLTLLFLFISYLFASWWCWWFGCSLGSRSFVEFYALLAIPLAFALKHLSGTVAGKIMLSAFIALCCLVYMDIEYYYDGCFYGGTWDWEAFLNLVTD